MKSIYACKLYKSSTRKDKIQAALSDVVNVELVKQLEEYLDEEYMPVTDVGTENLETSDVERVTDSDEAGETPTPSTHGSGHVGSPSGDSLSEKYGDELDAEGSDKFEATQPHVDVSDDDSEDDSDAITKDANASTKTGKESIFAETVVTSSPVHSLDLSCLVGELKGTLNVRASTSGVVRVLVKNDEVWIYYNDETNLNNVMTPVIEFLNAANYGYLTFNRLARTDNAMVFTVNANDTLNTVGFVKDE